MLIGRRRDGFRIPSLARRRPAAALGLRLALAALLAFGLGLPVALGVPILFGVLRKELSLLMVYQALGTQDIAPLLDWVQIATFLVFLTFYVPCVSTFAVMLKTIGRRDALFSIGLSVVVALGIAGRELQVGDGRVAGQRWVERAEGAAAQGPVDVDVAGGGDLRTMANRSQHDDVAVGAEHLLAAAHRLGDDQPGGPALRLGLRLGRR